MKAGIHMLKEFKNFVSKGNILELTVGVIIGGTFTNIVKILADNVITPLIGLVVGFIFSGSRNVERITKSLVILINEVELKKL